MCEKNFQNFTGNPLFEKGFKTGKDNIRMRVKLEKPVLNKFFELIVASKDFVSWTKLSKKISCSRWTIKDVRLHNRTFPKIAFEELLELIDKNRRDYFLSQAKYLDDFWATKERWNRQPKNDGIRN